MTHSTPAPVAGAVEAKRLVSRLVVAACLQEREPSEANQNAYRAARDAVEAALHPQPAPAVAWPVDEVAVQEDTEYVSVRRFAVEWLKTHYPTLTIKAGLCESIGGRLYTRTCLAARSAPAVAEKVPLTVLQYNAIPELCAIKPSLYESVVRAIERAHGIVGSGSAQEGQAKAIITAEPWLKSDEVAERLKGQQ